MATGERLTRRELEARRARAADGSERFKRAHEGYRQMDNGIQLAGVDPEAFMSRYTNGP